MMSAGEGRVATSNSLAVNIFQSDNTNASKYMRNLNLGRSLALGYLQDEGKDLRTINQLLAICPRRATANAAWVLRAHHYLRKRPELGLMAQRNWSEDAKEAFNRVLGLKPTEAAGLAVSIVSGYEPEAGLIRPLYYKYLEPECTSTNSLQPSQKGPALKILKDHFQKLGCKISNGLDHD